MTEDFGTCEERDSSFLGVAKRALGLFELRPPLDLLTEVIANDESGRFRPR